MRVTLERAAEDEGDVLDFQVIEVSDADGNALPRETVALQLQTLKDDTGYWLDTGIFSIPV